MKEASKWTKKAFPKGPDPMKHSEETEFNIAYIIGEVESNHHDEHMPSYCYATCQSRCTVGQKTAPMFAHFGKIGMV